MLTATGLCILRVMQEIQVPRFYNPYILLLIHHDYDSFSSLGLRRSEGLRGDTTRNRFPCFNYYCHLDMTTSLTYFGEVCSMSVAAFLRLIRGTVDRADDDPLMSIPRRHYPATFGVQPVLNLGTKSGNEKSQSSCSRTRGRMTSPYNNASPYCTSGP
ncbi:hypothetical protein EV421DRAFT_330865 [Armillaria borealis]|uniref:Uncharacterized protein n=1 Tax=Armillaria borealis TaxID=47425 RepID=A0AA39MTT5_9AGAR|nr:hypothetical protein EV421DRAFT_330865 [Armillaria borealis]